MGKAITVETQPVPRELLALFAKNHRVIKLLENLSNDVSGAIPSSLDTLLGLIEDAQQDGADARALVALVQGTAEAAAALALQAAQTPAPAPVIVEAFPIGSVFTSTDATNPAGVLGYGIWSAFGAGQVLVGYLAGDPDFGTPGGTGGAKNQAISAHGGTAVADHADHTHAVNSNVTATTDLFAAGAVPAVTSITNNPVATAGASAVLNHVVTQPNNHADVSVLQPYLTVYFWKRTA